MDALLSDENLIQFTQLQISDYGAMDSVECECYRVRSTVDPVAAAKGKVIMARLIVLGKRAFGWWQVLHSGNDLSFSSN